MYGKKEAVMTKGLAILSMLILHLFCRTGTDVYGTPLIWINETTPLVYYFGFFAEICVPIYTLCAGYAQQNMVNIGRGDSGQWKSNLHRIWKLLINYWIILTLFSLLGLILPSDGSMPGSLLIFCKSVVLVHSYNGAWWFLNTYIVLMLIPPAVILFPVKKSNIWFGLIGCFGLQVGLYLLEKIGFMPAMPFTQPVLAFAWKEALNLIHVLPYFWVGAFFCKGNIVSKAKIAFEQIKPKCQKLVLLSLFICLFVSVSVIHKAVLMLSVAILTFLLFNLWQKGKIAEWIFGFLGKHSTNIWLTHMFFYGCVFEGFVQKMRYPLFMLLFLLICSIAASYVVMGIHALMIKIGRCLINANKNNYLS